MDVMEQLRAYVRDEEQFIAIDIENIEQDSKNEEFHRSRLNAARAMLDRLYERIPELRETSESFDPLEGPSGRRSLGDLLVGRGYQREEEHNPIKGKGLGDLLYSDRRHKEPLPEDLRYDYPERTSPIAENCKKIKEQ